MLGSRKIRIVAALFVCSAVVALIWPRATGYVSRFAVVNAPVVTVRAPINGVILQPTPGVAAPVLRDEVLFDLRATQTSRAEIARLRSELQVRRTEARALAEQERGAEAVVAGLRARIAAETESEITFLTRKLEEVRALRRLHEVAWDRALGDVVRLTELAARGRVAETERDTAGFRLREAEAELDADDALIAALKIEIAAIEAGLPSPAGTGRRDFAYDRLDDIEMALADIRTRHAAAAARRDSLAQEVRAAEADLEELARFRPTAATNGVIWTASRQAGASVTLGSDLFQVLDCERRFIEVVFEERTFEALPAGTRARVRLRGAEQSFEAVVVSRQATARGAALSAVDAAVLEPYETGGVRVFLRIDPADPGEPGVAAAFCDVGRTAEVFVRRNGVSTLLAPLARQWSALFPAPRETAANRAE